jgi:hypothetical protein
LARDLVEFCLSADYAELREALGLRIEVKVAQAAGRERA